MADDSGSQTAPREGSTLDPLHYTPFLILWIATLVSNIGTWMQNAAAGWLMTGLTQDPFIISMVQVATMLPVVLFGLPAGALADIVDRRKLLIAVNSALVALIAVLAVLVEVKLATPTVLLFVTFLAGIAAALIAPSWQAIVPDLVPRQDLQAAISLNSIGVNISRAVGPAMAGLLIGTVGLAAPFWVNALSTLGVIAALIWWRPADNTLNRLPAERVGSALWVGLRHARHNPHLSATLIRAAGFFVFASAYWALLPLVARNQIDGGPQLYGLLLGTIGIGAVAGAFLLPQLKARLGPDKLVMTATAGTAFALILFGLAHHPAIAFAASLAAGLSWIAVLAPLNVSAQVGLPLWVKGRGLALFATVQFGGMALGSAMWGQIAKWTSLPLAHFLAAAGTLIAIPLLSRWKLYTGASDDLTPSLHWPAPIVARDIHPDRGPVLITIEYQIDPADRVDFIAAITEFSHERMRDGAYDWGLYEDAAAPGQIQESFLVPSWLEHQRQHQRVTFADYASQQRVLRFHKGNTPPLVRHLIAAQPGDTADSNAGA